jgi:drug/metabolite transporter (DMT)-like permease
MPGSELLAILAGLGSAVGFGVGDFGGGLASRRTNPYLVVLVGQITGVVALLLIAFWQSPPLPPTADLLAAAVAGIMGTLGVVRFYGELARGRMGVVAPLTAVVTVTIPVLFGSLTEGLPQPTHLVGILLAVASIWLITQSSVGAPVTLRDLANILLMGLLFSIFIVVIGTISDRSIVWPITASRSASIPILIAIVAFTRGRGIAVTRGQMPLLVFVGLLDVCGSGLFAVSSALGRLDIAAVITSLYPAVTVLLARTILSEEINGRQWAGIALALAAIALITI